MRDRMERLVLFPFAVGCMSESSIGIASQHPRRSSSSRFPQSPPPSIITKRTEGHEESEEEDQTLSGDQCSKTSWPLPKPNLSVGMNRLFKGFKNFSHLFVYKEDQDEEEGKEMEIEIGVPTDVKHVTHIGWDGFVGATNNYPNNIKGGGCSKYWRPDDSSTADFLISDHQKLKLLAAKFNDHDHYHHHQLDQVPDDPFSSTTTADPAPIPGDLHDQDCEEIASALRSRSIIDHH